MPNEMNPGFWAGAAFWVVICISYELAIVPRRTTFKVKALAHLLTAVNLIIMGSDSELLRPLQRMISNKVPLLGNFKTHLACAVCLFMCAYRRCHIRPTSFVTHLWTATMIILLISFTLPKPYLRIKARFQQKDSDNTKSRWQTTLNSAQSAGILLLTIAIILSKREQYAFEISTDLVLSGATENQFTHSYDKAVEAFRKGSRTFNDGEGSINGNTNFSAISGTGSEIDRSQELIDFLPKWLLENHVTSMVECPSGHWPSGWQRVVKWPPLKYTMLDINAAVAKDNQEYLASGNAPKNIDGTAGVHDFLREPLPKADVLLTRHVLHHMPVKFIQKYLDLQVRVCPPRFKYVMIVEPYSDIPEIHNPNHETGKHIGWRTLNMSQPPFNLPTKLLFKQYWVPRMQESFPNKHCKNKCMFDAVEVYEPPQC